MYMNYFTLVGCAVNAPWWPPVVHCHHGRVVAPCEKFTRIGVVEFTRDSKFTAQIDCNGESCNWVPVWQNVSRCRNLLVDATTMYPKWAFYHIKRLNKCNTNTFKCFYLCLIYIICVFMLAMAPGAHIIVFLCTKSTTIHHNKMMNFQLLLWSQ